MRVGHPDDEPQDENEASGCDQMDRVEDEWESGSDGLDLRTTDCDAHDQLDSRVLLQWGVTRLKVAVVVGGRTEKLPLG